MKLLQFLATVYTITLCNFFSYLLKITSNISLLERGIGIIFEGTLVILSLVLAYKTFFQKEKEQPEVFSVNSVEFWKKVSIEYNPEYDYGLCKSRTFAIAWIDQKSKLQIVNLAKMFLKEDFNDNLWEVPVIVIFLFEKTPNNPRTFLHLEDEEAIRRAFIKWIIAHLNKKHI